MQLTINVAMQICLMWIFMFLLISRFNKDICYNVLCMFKSIIQYTNLIEYLRDLYSIWQTYREYLLDTQLNCLVVTEKLLDLGYIILCLSIIVIVLQILIGNFDSLKGLKNNVMKCVQMSEYFSGIFLILNGCFT